MAKKLERDLSLLQISAISVGAMVGSGIFILPALALEMAGPAVVFAYFLAGLLVLPAALSKSEMATAMPEAGGTYLYIERGLGPALGTIAGIGTWFSLTFKSGLALVGGVPYVFPDISVKPVAVGLGILLILLNIFGTKQSGQFQTILVAIMLAALTWFVAGSAPQMTPAHFEGFFDQKIEGVLKATGFVFVSYAGVTKVASVAEEVEDPGRNIPLGMLGSLGFTTVLYVLLVAVMVGVVEPVQLAGSVIPMSDAASATLGSAGYYVVVAAALLALISTANAGILSASRYPLAMARDRLCPEGLREISDRFGTPIRAISLTGALLLFLVAVFPISEIAKLASAFKILVFVIVNVAVVAFREGKEDYDPEFRSPLYPWTQAFGVIGGLVLLTQMGTFSFVGAILIVVGSTGWYLYWGRRTETDREGEDASDFRRRITERIVQSSRAADGPDEDRRVLIALPEGTDMSDEYHMMQIGCSWVGPEAGDLSVMQFDDVADQVPLDFAVERLSPADRSFEERSRSLEEQLGFEITYGEIAAHDIDSSLVNYVEHKKTDVLLIPSGRRSGPALLSASQRRWLLDNAPCDVLFVDVGDLDVVREVAVVALGGADQRKRVEVADAIAHRLSLPLRVIRPVEPDGSGGTVKLSDGTDEELADLCRAEVAIQRLETTGPADGGIAAALEPTDLAVVEVDPDETRGSVLERFGVGSDDPLPCPSIQFQTRSSED